MLGLAGCAVTTGISQVFESAPNPIDTRIDAASIEDYILALPPFAYHEESMAQFAARVRRARALEKENQEKNSEQLFVRGDGTSPSKEFSLNRKSRTLTIRYYNWEPGAKNSTITMRRVSGGWIKGLSSQPILSSVAYPN